MKQIYLMAVTAGAILLLGLAWAPARAEPPAGPPPNLIPLEQLHRQLKLTPSQEQQWRRIASQAKAFREKIRPRWQRLAEEYRRELDKPAPDLARIAALADTLRDQQRQEARVLQEQRLSLYASFTPIQKTVVRDALRQRLEQRQRRYQRPSNRAAPTDR